MANKTAAVKATSITLGIAWDAYARPRFTDERKADHTLACLLREVSAQYAGLAEDAALRGGVLQFAKEDLALAVVRSLDHPCEYCGKYFGTVAWGVARRDPAVLRPDAVARNGVDYSLAKYAVCCAPCAGPKQLLSDFVWRELLMILRRCPQEVSEEVVRRLGKGTSPPLPAA